MTPEERIAALESAISISSSRKERCELLATAIRSAEITAANDALERAAVKIIAASGVAATSSATVRAIPGLHVAVQIIRSLKGKHQ